MSCFKKRTACFGFEARRKLNLHSLKLLHLS
jgi:hypothetical protein